MINVEALEKHSQANPLHPQVLIKLKEQALGQFMTYIPEPKESTDDYYDDCATFYDWMMENVPENMGDQEFEDLCEAHWKAAPTKWQPFEYEEWSSLVNQISEYFEVLKNLASDVIALQQLGPISEFICEQ